MLLEFDGLDDDWNDGVPSVWQGDLRQFDVDELQHAFPNIAPSQRDVDLDFSNIGVRFAKGDDSIEVETHTGFFEKRNALITHFNYCASLPPNHPHAIKWPKRNKRNSQVQP